MKIEDISNVVHGIILSRVESKAKDAVAMDLFSIQDLSYETGQYHLNIETQQVEIDPEKMNSVTIAKKNQVVIGLTSHKACKIEEQHAEKLVPSYFALITLDEEVINPDYFVWYFNENQTIQRQLATATQGTSIKALSIQMLRSCEIELPSMETQQKIGEIYRLRKLKEKLSYRKNKIEDDLINQLCKKQILEEK